MITKHKLHSLALLLAAPTLGVTCCAAAPQVNGQTIPQPATAQEEMIAPDQWLKTQTTPVYRPGHTLPLLTRFAWTLSVPTRVELAEKWGYALEWGGYLTDSGLGGALAKPDSEQGKVLALAVSNPKKYPLAVILSRDEPPNPAPATHLRDAESNLIDGKKVYSPLNPQSVLDQMAELRARPLRALQGKVPVAFVLNGGEYGLGVLGFIKPIAEKDPTVQAARGTQDWFDFLSQAKGKERNTIATAVKAAAPNRQLYIYYNSGNVERNRFWGWKDWSYDDTYTITTNSDLPSNEFYFKHFNSGYMPDAGGNDILTRALNAVGFQIGHGRKNSYDWLSAGWVQEADGRGNPLPPKPPKTDAVKPATPELQEGNAAMLVDPNGGVLSSLESYTGFLKCLFTAGTLGGNAGYYALPIGGFSASFSTTKPHHWIRQMTALSHVQALFSYLEGDLRKGELLPGPKMHRWSKEQPAYEFPTGNPGVRVLARKMPGEPKWLITAWAADGTERESEVEIPELGRVTLVARPAGSVYRASLKGGKPVLRLLDIEPMTPTADKATLKALKSAA